MRGTVISHRERLAADAARLQLAQQWRSSASAMSCSVRRLPRSDRAKGGLDLTRL
jgi:hypothetical protein